MKKLLTMLSMSTTTSAIVPSTIACKIDQNSYNLELGLDQPIYRFILKTSEKTDADKIKDAIEALSKIENEEIESPSSYVNGQYCSMIWDIKYAIKTFAKYTNAIKEVILKEDINLELKLRTRHLFSDQTTKELTFYDWVLFGDTIIVKGIVQAGKEEENFKFTVKVKKVSSDKVSMRDEVWNI